MRASEEALIMDATSEGFKRNEDRGPVKVSLCIGVNDCATSWMSVRGLFVSIILGRSALRRDEANAFDSVPVNIMQFSKHI